MGKLTVATYGDFLDTFAEMLVGDWQAKNGEPFVNSGDFPKQAGRALENKLRVFQEVTDDDDNNAD